MERKGRSARTASTDGTKKIARKPQKKISEYGKQLQEKQRVKQMYGMRERQFKRFFAYARKVEEATGDALLSLLERRLDNVVFRAKLASSRSQARQIIVHGHFLVNGKKVYSPAYLVTQGDVVSLSPKAREKEGFVKQVVQKRLQTAARVPEWLELDRRELLGRVLRVPVRTDIVTPIEEHLIVELYSK